MELNVESEGEEEGSGISATKHIDPEGGSFCKLSITTFRGLFICTYFIIIYYYYCYILLLYIMF